jgi:hypothetical protein
MAWNGLRHRSRGFVDLHPSMISTSCSSDESCEEESVTTKRTKTKSSPRLVGIIPLTLVTILIVCLLVILLGAEVERRFIDNYHQTSTLELYTKDDYVCALADTDNSSSPGMFETFVHASEVDTSHKIAHCGACGSCSTMHDMEIIAKTTRTLTDKATWCTTKAFLQSFFLTRGVEYYKNVARMCLEQTVGFTPACQQCWVQDMACSNKHCIFSCLKSLYLKREPKNLKDGSLNKCLECDEKVCGPAFLQCAGANRRRQGIVSDIQRDDDHELCRLVQMDWSTTT